MSISHTLVVLASKNNVIVSRTRHHIDYLERIKSAMTTEDNSARIMWHNYCSSDCDKILSTVPSSPK